MQSRSAVFENVLDQLGKRMPRPIVVASAGNRAKSTLAFPARFGDVVAVGAVRSDLMLASYSNYGETDQAGRYHGNRYVAPGGEIDSAAAEPVLKSGPGSVWAGTSFAAALASGLIADRIARIGISKYNYDELMISLRASANKDLPNFAGQQAKYRNGLLVAS